MASLLSKTLALLIIMMTEQMYFEQLNEIIMRVSHDLNFGVVLRIGILSRQAKQITIAFPIAQHILLLHSSRPILWFQFGGEIAPGKCFIVPTTSSNIPNHPLSVALCSYPFCSSVKMGNYRVRQIYGGFTFDVKI